MGRLSGFGMAGKAGFEGAGAKGCVVCNSFYVLVSFSLASACLPACVFLFSERSIDYATRPHCAAALLSRRDSTAARIR